MAYDVDINRLGEATLINLRGDQAVAEGFAEALGMAWPTEPGSTQQNKDVTVLWLSPDQWLVRAPPAQEGALFSILHGASKGQFAAVTVVSDHYCGFRIEGKHARDILVQACSLDLDEFATGRCARGTFARTRALIQSVEQYRVYDVFGESSYAHYLAQWLAAARVGVGPAQPYESKEMLV